MSKWVHVIGVAGVTTSGVAVMFKNLGWKVTGSDKGFYPPVSTFLEAEGIMVMPGFKPERLTINDSHPDLVVFQGTKGSSNPEYQEAVKLQLAIKTYPEVLQEFVINKDKSVVVAGTYGKTTTTAALVKMLMAADRRPGWMFGGLTTDGTPPVQALTDTNEYSVVEGDEYLISTEDRRSKFLLYSPTFLILTALKWDHPDLFPSRDSYLQAFRELLKLLPVHGVIVANANDQDVVDLCRQTDCRTVFYSIDHASACTKPDWILTRDSKPLPAFIKDSLDPEIIPYEKQLIGDFNEENLLAAAVMSTELGIKKERIQEAISEFTGIRRRLEIKYKSAQTIVIDDFGSSPPKARGALQALRSDYPEANIVAVFEPNTGNRVQEAVPEYEEAFKDADTVIFPRFTRLPKSSTVHLDAAELAERIMPTHGDLRVHENDTELVDLLSGMIKHRDVQTIVVFMGSHSFRGMIDQLTDKLHEEKN